jgi:hypothetical protein
MDHYQYERLAGTIEQYALLASIARYLTTMFDMDEWCVFLIIIGALYEILYERDMIFNSIFSYTESEMNDFFLMLSRKIIDRAGIAKLDHDVFVELIGIYQTWNAKQKPPGYALTRQ